VSEQHALGLAVGARCVDDAGAVVRGEPVAALVDGPMDFRRQIAPRIQDLVEGVEGQGSLLAELVQVEGAAPVVVGLWQDPAALDEDDPPEVWRGGAHQPGCHQRVLCQQQVCTGVLELGEVLRRRHGGVEGHRHGTDHQHGDVQLKPGLAGGAEQGDAVARGNALGKEPGGDSPSVLVPVSPGGRLPAPEPALAQSGPVDPQPHPLPEQMNEGVVGQVRAAGRSRGREKRQCPGNRRRGRP
jgi:hypothetical protein